MVQSFAMNTVIMQPSFCLCACMQYGAHDLAPCELGCPFFYNWDNLISFLCILVSVLFFPYYKHFLKCCQTGGFEPWLSRPEPRVLNSLLAANAWVQQQPVIKTRSPVQSWVLSRQINNLVADMAQLKSLTQQLKLYNPVACTFLQRPPYNSIASHLSCGDYRGA